LTSRLKLPRLLLYAPISSLELLSTITHARKAHIVGSAVRTIACGTDIEVILDLGRGEYECEALVVDLLVAFAGAQIEESVIEDLVEEDVPKCIYHEHGGSEGECYWVKRRWLYG
jgi:hypothetical protein